MSDQVLRIGIDVGSTTVKLAVLNAENELIYKRYDRHLSNIFEKVSELLKEAATEMGDPEVRVTITGSGGLALANILEQPFAQEVISCSKAIETFIPRTDVAIELGGEDAKITFYKPSIEQRMNGTCAGGTGAFIDQMAVLLNTDSMGLNEFAKEAERIYPIAARCGVFAKTDIQPLINEGAKKEDIAASIFQSVVNQTITGLACGRTIKGNVAFLGGPLHFLPELRQRFIETLGLKEEEILVPEDAHYYVAMGAALMCSEDTESIRISDLDDKLRHSKTQDESATRYLPPLFETEEDYLEFAARHAQDRVERGELSEAEGPLYLGIDAGSTTTKAALIDSDCRLLYSFYKNNEGKPLEAAGEMLRELFPLIPEKAYIANTVSTGYGEALIKAAYGADFGEIETMAHFKAANFFMPGVTFILDIGGQDMKCMMVKEGYIYNILLNEACSSGCGSFIETYAKSMDLSVSEFAEKALEAKDPVDLGTRCTVFMNSKVKQAQKEGATIGDVSAGLSYSVIKNALYKVIKLRNPEDAGDKIVVQGGTFLNDAVLRSIEQILGRNVVRPDISGIMGAFGAAILGRERWEEGHVSTLINPEDLKDFSAKVSTARCGLCENNCLLTINIFPGGKRFVTGNRCERGAGAQTAGEEIPNLYQYKLHRLFDYEPLPEEEAPRGVVGIPRVLNMYENYPFWFTLFTKLGFRVILSPHSSKSIYELGIDTISSDTACYPAKLVHGHIRSLVNQGIDHIFYPSINHEVKEDPRGDNHYNCPIVATYPEVVGNNMDECFNEYGVWFDHPFMPYHDKEKLALRFYEHYKDSEYGFTLKEVQAAVREAMAEDQRFKTEIRDKAREIIEDSRKVGRKIVVLAGRPYHLDPEINHGLDEIITSYGMAVVTEDSVAWMSEDDRRFRVLNQWMYHSRLYRAAEIVSQNDDMELIQINSFGCGVDAVTTDQVNEIMDMNNKLYTLIKIDEGSNLGAARIRIRSLKVATEDRERNGIKPHPSDKPYVNRVPFTKEMRKNYTMLMPQMAPYHFTLIERVLRSEGYDVKLLPKTTREDIEWGLKYINNDACYPTIVSLGQMIRAVQSGEYDTDHLALMMSQTGGGCRASNYIALLRYALKQMGLSHIPVISFNLVGMEKNPGFSISASLIIKAVKALLFGDLITELLYRVRPYEVVPGSADALYEKCNERMLKEVESAGFTHFRKLVRFIIKEFEEFEIDETLEKPKVGVVGEILVKYHPGANNDIVGTIEREGGEAVVPGMLDFFLYGFYNKKFNYEKLAGSFKDMAFNMTALKAAEKVRDIVRGELKGSKRFHVPERIEEVAAKAENILSMGSQCGEGWLLTGEMVELMDRGIENIVCLQPFACLPNHVTGKGMIKPMRKYNEWSNICAIDFDPGASEVNQLNRIKLMMATAFKNMEKKKALEAEKKTG